MGGKISGKIGGKISTKICGKISTKIFVYLCICTSDTQKYCFWNCICVFVYSCICVFVYLHVRHPGILFLRSLYHYVFKNIAYVRSIWNFDQRCICLLVYLCICIFVYLYVCICTSDNHGHHFWGPRTITFSKI